MVLRSIWKYSNCYCASNIDADIVGFKFKHIVIACTIIQARNSKY